MTRVQIENLPVSNVLEIVYALRETDYVQNKDYYFEYYKAEFEMLDVHTAAGAVQCVGAQKTPNRVVYTFMDSAVAIWFVLRFGGTVVSDENSVDDK